MYLSIMKDKKRFFIFFQDKSYRSPLSTLISHRFQQPLSLILHILPNQLFEPGKWLVVPALGVEVEHGLAGECSFIHCPDDITGGGVL